MRTTAMSCAAAFVAALTLAPGAAWAHEARRDTLILAQSQSPQRSPDVPFVPTKEEVVEKMLELGEVDGNDVVYDLGSGDGRLPIAAAKKYGARGFGVDIDPNRVREARENAQKAGVQDKVKFVQGDLFETDIGDASVVTLYLLPSEPQAAPEAACRTEAGDEGRVTQLRHGRLGARADREGGQPRGVRVDHPRSRPGLGREEPVAGPGVRRAR